MYLWMYVYPFLCLQHPYLACLQIHEAEECERRPVLCSLCGVEVAFNLVSLDHAFGCLLTWLILILYVGINTEQALWPPLDPNTLYLQY